jgi:hypothetical protein
MGVTGFDFGCRPERSEPWSPDATLNNWENNKRQSSKGTCAFHSAGRLVGPSVWPPPCGPVAGVIKRGLLRSWANGL